MTNVRDQTILVTGASGFVATHVLNAFLERGYKIRGTVRSEDAVARVRKSHGKYGDQLSFAFVKDVAAPGAFDEAVKGVQGVIHTASPYQLNVADNERDLLDPAINGTNGILLSIQKYAPEVKRVVITSSFAAVIDSSKGRRPAYTYTEEDWNPLDREAAKAGSSIVAYSASKKLAEKAAWDFVNAHGDNLNFKITTLCPPMVYGPLVDSTASIDHLNTSSADIYRLFNGSEKTVPVTRIMGYVDVRDLAQAHLRAFEIAAAAGNRYLIARGGFTYQQFVDVIRKEFPELRDRLPGGQTDVPYPDAYVISNEKAKKDLGVTFRTLEETIVDTVKTLLALEKHTVSK